MPNLRAMKAGKLHRTGPGRCISPNIMTCRGVLPHSHSQTTMSGNTCFDACAALSSLGLHSARPYLPISPHQSGSSWQSEANKSSGKKAKLPGWTLCVRFKQCCMPLLTLVPVAAHSKKAVQWLLTGVASFGTPPGRRHEQHGLLREIPGPCSQIWDLPATYAKHLSFGLALSPMYLLQLARAAQIHCGRSVR